MKSVIIIAIAVVFGIGIGLSLNVSAEEGLIPAWIKSTAGFWVEGNIGDSEFLSALQYLVKEGILVIPSEQNENCDSSYPDVCIPPYPPDLNCGDIGYSNFRVIGNDPHGFDRDNDGIGCES